jgi:hypothetical protein
MFIINDSVLFLTVTTWLIVPVRERLIWSSEAKYTLTITNIKIVYFDVFEVRSVLIPYVL